MIAQTLALFHRALSGREDEFATYMSDPLQHPDTMTRVWLRDTDADVRVALAHRALHHALGTFDLDLVAMTDRYPRGLLAADLYALLEDVRIEAAADRLLAGLTTEFDAARTAALHERPDLATLAPRAAAAEALVRYSLRAEGVQLAASLHRPVAAIVAAARAAAQPGATAAGSARLVGVVYAHLAELHNVDVPTGEGRWLEFADARPVPTPAITELDGAPGEVLDLRLVPVGYRDVPGPRYRGLDSTAMPPTDGVAPLEPSGDAGDDDADGADAEGGTVSDPKPAVADVSATDPGVLSSDDVPGVRPTGSLLDQRVTEGQLRPRDRHESVYPEWDGYAGRYLPAWTRVRAQRPPLVAGAPVPRPTARRYAHLLPPLVDALERVHPTGRDISLRLPDGDDLDLDACVVAVSDRRAGLRPSERVHSQLTPSRRDVAVAFALDLSASTAVRLPPRPDREPERILDLERDAVALVAAALQRIGDAYAIYGFSGAGRDNVVVSVVKELRERYSAATLRRLASLVPDHTTRMAPAIRYITDQLTRFDARTRILVVVSDGRPFDIDYGQAYGERAILPYAVADTAKALAEARRRKVRPYLITVDPAGNDYLGAMCDPREYHVITDARDLPESLAQLYLVARDDARALAASAPSYSGAFSK